jgi:putative sterol carrier protein
VQQQRLPALASQLAALRQPRQAAAELLVDDPRALASDRLRERDGQGVDLRFSRQGDLDWYCHGAAMLSRVACGSDTQGAEMSEAVQEFFQTLESRADSSKTAGMTNSYLFNIEGAGTWKVDVDDGTVTVTEGGDDADAVISASAETFQKIVAGEQNPTSAYMTGKLKIKGDMGAAMKLQKLF